jgi:multiple sugar transport system ATP-binding protein
MFVASFIGSPQMNLVEGELVMEGDRARVKGPYFEFVVAATPLMSNGPVVLGFRPEHLVPTQDPAHAYRAEVEVIEPMGSEAFVYLKAGKGNVVARLDEADIPKLGDTIALSLDGSKIHLFDPKTEGRLN